MAKYRDFCEKRITHLQMIEAVIDRMAANSLRMKEWFVTIGSAIVGFAVTKENLTLALVALGPLALFWILDAFYLYQERLFRDLYIDVINDKAAHPFSMATKKGIGKFVLSVLWSWSTMGFYGLILLGSGTLFFFREDIGRLIATNDATVIKKVVIEDATVESSLIFRE